MEGCQEEENMAPFRYRQLQNKHFDRGGQSELRGKFYQYAHDFENHWVDQQYCRMF